MLTSKSPIIIKFDNVLKFSNECSNTFQHLSELFFPSKSLLSAMSFVNFTTDNILKTHLDLCCLLSEIILLPTSEVGITSRSCDESMNLKKIKTINIIVVLCIMKNKQNSPSPSFQKLEYLRASQS